MKLIVFLTLSSLVSLTISLLLSDEWALPGDCCWNWIKSISSALYPSLFESFFLSEEGKTLKWFTTFHGIPCSLCLWISLLGSLFLIVALTDCSFLDLSALTETGDCSSGLPASGASNQFLCVSSTILLLAITKWTKELM